MTRPSWLRRGGGWGGALAAAGVVAACANSWYGSASTDWNARGRAAYDLPIRFVIDSTSLPPGAIGCATTIYDPRDNRMLRLTQSGKDDSGSYRGDYEVTPIGRYGVRGGEQLRVDCGNGRALGIVPEPKPDS